MIPRSQEIESARVRQDSRKQEILSAETCLLFGNSNVGVGVTLLTAATLALLQWGVVPNYLLIGWWLYTTLIAVARGGLAHRYRVASPACAEVGKWRAAFVIGTGLAGIGWGAAGFLLYSEYHLTSQLFLVFVVGGMMLGAGFLLAPRPEAFLAFLLPTGLIPTIRILVQGDEMHLAMGLLTGVFTLATLITTWRIHRAVDLSLRLQFENQDLVEDLQAAKNQTEAANQVLELRVRERTAELHRSNEQLRTEIVQREQMKEELLRARKLESLGVLAGGIAHDFNNFLMVVQGNVELAKAQLDDGDRVQEFLNQIASAYQRAAMLSSQLLTFAKGGSPIRRPVSIAKLVTDAVHLARAGAPTSIAVYIAEDLGFAQVDPAQISQALHNLLLNARQAMPEGGIIEVRAERLANAPFLNSSHGEQGVRISVRDFGCGIPSDVLPRIFDPYFTTKRGRSGLGLATAYAIVTKHGGHISVESKSGEGTVFAIYLPASYQGPAALPRPVITSMQTGTEHVLVMDDDEAVRHLLDTVLTNLGYHVQTARGGAEAIAAYEEAKIAGKRFDAVLLDLTVSGGMGGTEAAAKLKEIDPSARLIVSSGYSDSPVMSEYAKYGFEAVIPKPSTAAEIRAAFQKVLVADPDHIAD